MRLDPLYDACGKCVHASPLDMSGEALCRGGAVRRGVHCSARGRCGAAMRNRAAAARWRDCLARL